MTEPSGPRLAAHVDVTDPDGRRVWLGPDDEVPGWAVKQIVNEKAWESGEAPKSEDAPADPKKSGAAPTK